MPGTLFPQILFLLMTVNGSFYQLRNCLLIYLYFPFMSFPDIIMWVFCCCCLIFIKVLHRCLTWKPLFYRSVKSRQKFASATHDLGNFQSILDFSNNDIWGYLLHSMPGNPYKEEDRKQRWADSISALRCYG